MTGGGPCPEGATLAPSLTPLTPPERRLLLRVARDSIRAAVLREPMPEPQGLPPALVEAGAAFVSLHHNGELRGCIGSLSAEGPLYAAVSRAAQAAALEDPRFPPVALGEIPGLEIEISRLSPLVQVPPEAVVPGVHGVSLQIADRRAVFLPQVAPKYGWDRETLLRELCEKARLPPDAWRRPEARVSVFVAEVFSDASEGPVPGEQS